MSSKGLTKVFSSIVEKVKYTGFSERELRELEEEFLLHLVENDVALDVAEALLRELTSKLSSVKVSRFADKGRVALEVLREVILEPFEKVSGETLEKRIEAVREAYEKPFSVVFLGPNGHGKTTTVAKLAYRLSNLG
ncbi:MAG: hypothetical protein QXI96_01535, partial [Thermofilum sp.]